jgi:hypothetical protein
LTSSSPICRGSGRGATGCRSTPVRAGGPGPCARRVGPRAVRGRESPRGCEAVGVSRQCAARARIGADSGP